MRSFVLRGIDAVSCEIEIDLNLAQLPKTTIVGLPDTAVRESAQRVRTAILNSGFLYPRARVVINLAPAHIQKEGPVYDLPIAVAILQASGTIEPAGPQERPKLEDYLVAGELALDGRVRPIRGVISFALLAQRLGARGVIVPAGNAPEAAAVDNLDVLGVSVLAEVVALFNGQERIAPHPPIEIEPMIARAAAPVDFADIKGQEAAKRALTVAAAGGHNILMIGPPGTGKTLFAKALGGILPPLTRDEALEVTRIYSSIGALPADQPFVLWRPVRTPHHSASAAAIIGGGSIPRPGDVSLAHRGVLFLDEMPEFTRQVLETLRQPLEDGVVTIARARGSVRFPARFMLVGAMNPTQHGEGSGPDPSPRAVDRYVARLSRPLIDRIDLHVEVPAIPFRQLTSDRRGTDTATMRERVEQARAVQRERQGPVTNCELSGKQLDRYAVMDGEARQLLAQAMTELDLSARAYDKIRRVARTVADLERAPSIRAHQVAEAVQYRLLDRGR